MTGIILVLAANTAFNGFPVLGSILAKDGLMPRQLGSRGDRLAFSNGIVILAVMAIVLIVLFDAQPTRLIQLYIVGVFVSFNLSQLGMIRHWTRHLRTETDPAKRRRMMRSRAINTFGLGMTAIVLVIVLVTKFLAGAWITILAMGTFFVLMNAINKHYKNVSEELVYAESDQVLPTRVHAIVAVSKLHKPTMRALAYAKASRPNVLEAVYVDIDSAATARMLEEWDDAGIDIPLKVLYSPYREIIRPITEYVGSIREASPRGVVAVYLPEYVVGRWWEQLLHNQTALRLKGRLLFTPGVMVDLGALPAALLRGRARARATRREPPPARGRAPRPGRRPRRPVAHAAVSGGVGRPGRRRRPGGRGRPRPQGSRPSVAGRRYETEVGPVAHGGHCVARVPTGDEGPGVVVFVRHALPGERVVVELTEGREGDRFWRGDAVEVLDASPHRVPAPCPLAHPGGCGGCDFQHVSLAEQRRLKAAVVTEQLARLGGVTWPDLEVEAVPGDEPAGSGLGWRTRVRYAVDAEGRAGLRRHRSHDVEPLGPLTACPLGHPALPGVDGTWPVGSELVVTATSTGQRSLRVLPRDAGTLQPLAERVHDRTFAVAEGGFWQAHAGAAPALVTAVLAAAGVRDGDVVLDLFAGAGLFSLFLADAAGPRGSLWVVEGDAGAAQDAADNLAGTPSARVLAGPVAEVLAAGAVGEACDVVVLDPPRAGARQAVVDAVCGLGPRTVVYVACDPAALARDVAFFSDQGYALVALRALDLFPMTHHVGVRGGAAAGLSCPAPLLSRRGPGSVGPRRATRRGSPWPAGRWPARASPPRPRTARRRPRRGCRRAVRECGRRGWWR